MWKHEGNDVRISEEGCIFVRVRQGIIFKREAWKEVSLKEVSLNSYYPHDLVTPYGRFQIADLGLDHQSLSTLLGISRLDPDRAQSIWKSPNSVRGNCLAIDFDSSELSFRAPQFPQSESKIVYPFSAIAGISLDDEPRLIQKNATVDWGYLKIEGLPMTPSELAQRMRIPQME